MQIAAHAGISDLALPGVVPERGSARDLWNGFAYLADKGKGIQLNWQPWCYQHMGLSSTQCL